MAIRDQSRNSSGTDRRGNLVFCPHGMPATSCGACEDAADEKYFDAVNQSVQRIRGNPDC